MTGYFKIKKYSFSTELLIFFIWVFLINLNGASADPAVVSEEAEMSSGNLNVIDEGLTVPPLTEMDIIEEPPAIKRDPFQPPKDVRDALIELKPTPAPTMPILPPEKPKEELTLFNLYPLKEYRLQAVLWSPRSPKAIFKAPDGSRIQAKEGLQLGQEKAVLWKIKKDQVIFVIPNEGDYRTGRIYVQKFKYP